MWKFDKVNMYCFFKTSDKRPELEVRKEGFVPDNETPIEERYIILRQGWYTSLRLIGNLNECLM